MDALQQHLPDALPESDEVAAGPEARILTWNINGLRKVAADNGGVKQLLDQFNADIGANFLTLLFSCTEGVVVVVSRVSRYCCTCIHYNCLAVFIILVYVPWIV